MENIALQSLGFQDNAASDDSEVSEKHMGDVFRHAYCIFRPCGVTHVCFLSLWHLMASQRRVKATPI